MFSAVPNAEKRYRNEAQRDELRVAEHPTKDKAAVGVTSEYFDEVAQKTVRDQEVENQLPLITVAFGSPRDVAINQETSNRLIDLCGVQRNVLQVHIGKGLWV